MSVTSNDELRAKYVLDVQRAQADEDKAAKVLAEAKARLKEAARALPEFAAVKDAKHVLDATAEYRAGLIRDGVPNLPFEE